MMQGDEMSIFIELINHHQYSMKMIRVSKPSMKSSLTICHAGVGIGNGRRRPGIMICSVLAC
jgi:hypothetical protein